MLNKHNENNSSNDFVQIEGRYANYFKIGYNAFEFIMDFSQFYPKGTENKFHTRIITSPAYAKAFLKIFQEAIEGYEQTYGPIKDNN